MIVRARRGDLRTLVEGETLPAARASVDTRNRCATSRTSSADRIWDDPGYYARIFLPSVHPPSSPQNCWQTAPHGPIHSRN
jgi:hypothetical protein